MNYLLMEITSLFSANQRNVKFDQLNTVQSLKNRFSNTTLLIFLCIGLLYPHYANATQKDCDSLVNPLSPSENLKCLNDHKVNGNNNPPVNPPTGGDGGGGGGGGGGTTDTTVGPIPTTFSEGESAGLNRGTSLSGQSGSMCNISNPINSATGNKVETVVDYIGAGASVLKFIRYYNSSAPITSTTTLGSKWRHSYDRKIVLNTSVTPNAATVYRPDGSEVIFYKQATSIVQKSGANFKWVTRSKISAGRLVQLNYSNYKLWEYSYGVSTNTAKSYEPTIEFYEHLSNSDIRLTKVVTPSGITKTLLYDTAGKLLAVRDRTGYLMLFAYDVAGNLKTITDPANKTIQYTISNNRLVKVTYQDLTTVRYVYEDTRFPNHMTGIIDQNNNRQATWRYDSLGRGIESSHGSTGTDKVSISYAGTSATYTDALGQQLTYNHTKIGGVEKVTSVDVKNVGCGSACDNGRKFTRFDVNGNLDSRVDSTGTVTDYVYDKWGRLIQKIEAKNTPAQRTTKIEWGPYVDRNYSQGPECIITDTNITKIRYRGSNVVISDPAERLLVSTDIVSLIDNITVYDTTDTTLFPNQQSKTCSGVNVIDAVRLDYPGNKIKFKRIKNVFYLNDELKSVIGPFSAPNLSAQNPSPSIVDYSNYEYDPKGNLARFYRKVAPSSTPNSTSSTIFPNVEYSNYDAYGRPGNINRFGKANISLTYDTLGRKDIVTTGNEVTNYDYYPKGQLKKVTKPNGSFLTYIYDDADRLTDITDQQGNTIHYTVDKRGNVTQTDIRDSLGTLKRTSRAVYRIDNKLSKTIGAENQTTSYGLVRGFGSNKSWQTDAKNTTTRYEYDALNRLATVTNGNNDNTIYVYDSNDNITSVTDPLGNKTLYRYDGLGNRTEKNSPDTGTTRYTKHDAKGNVLSKVDNSGNTTNYHYDTWGRIHTANFQDGSNIKYMYRRYSDTLEFATFTSANAKVRILNTYTHDEHSRISRVTHNYNYPDATTRTGSRRILLSTTYTNNAVTGNLDSMLTPGGHKIAYSYKNGQVNSIAVDTKLVMSNIQYDPFGPATSWTLGNGSVVKRVYNLDGELIRYPENSKTYVNKYDVNGNVQTISDAIVLKPLVVNQYDILDRIQGQSNIKSPILPISTSFSYGPNSNRNIGSYNGLDTFNVLVSNSNQLLDTTTLGYVPKTYSHDLNGNITGDGTQTYGYDARGKLVNFNNTFKYSYNALGQRISKLGPNIHVVYVYNSIGQILGEYDAFTLDQFGRATPIQEYIWFGGQPVAVIRGTSIFYIDSDHLGTPRSIRNKANTIVWSWSSDPYGVAKPNADVDNDGTLFEFNLRFAGQYYDKESGLHYNINRYYDPTTGRYLESDPIGLAGGLNTYGYVDGNPVNLIDPLGLAEDKFTRPGPTDQSGRTGGRVGGPITGPYTGSKTILKRKIGKFVAEQVVKRITGIGGLVTRSPRTLAASLLLKPSTFGPNQDMVTFKSRVESFLSSCPN